MKIYVASSWRNEQQQSVVEALRKAGHVAYDFRNPAPGNAGFSWKGTGLKDPRRCSASEFLQASMSHPELDLGFRLDMHALYHCDACVLLLPCGRSAHLEAGFAVGAGKPVYVLWLNDVITEAELMYLMCCKLCRSVPKLISMLKLDFGQSCVVCGCTDDDCSDCVERTGEPCSWIAPNLCSACGPDVDPAA